MARTKDKSNAERDRRICLLRRNGFTFSQIAEIEDLSRVRISQIVHEHYAELDEDEGRAEIATILEFAERKVVELINDPGFVMGPNGRVATDLDGEPVSNKPLINEAAKTLVIIADKRSRLFAWDRQQQRQSMAAAAATEAARASLEALAEAKAVKDAEVRLELEERIRREIAAEMRQVVPGEVIRELPPAVNNGDRD